MEISRNNQKLKELEARLSSIATFGGVQNSKAAQQAKEDLATAREESQNALDALKADHN